MLKKPKMNVNVAGAEAEEQAPAKAALAEGGTTTNWLKN
jgi:hypothetical protein